MDYTFFMFTFGLMDDLRLFRALFDLYKVECQLKFAEDRLLPLIKPLLTPYFKLVRAEGGVLYLWASLIENSELFHVIPLDEFLKLSLKLGRVITIGDIHNWIVYNDNELGL